MQPILFILIGPKGSGKTYIGTLVQEKLNIPFFRVEDVWLKNKEKLAEEEYEKKGFELVEKEIDEKLSQTNTLVIESTGASDYFDNFLNSLSLKYFVRLIKVSTPIELCMKRIATRDHSTHIPVSDDRIEKINEKALQVQLDFDMEIDNANATDEEIVNKVKTLFVE